MVESFPFIEPTVTTVNCLQYENDMTHNISQNKKKSLSARWGPSKVIASKGQCHEMVVEIIPSIAIAYKKHKLRFFRLKIGLLATVL
jgi:hypothetical protein